MNLFEIAQTVGTQMIMNSNKGEKVSKIYLKDDEKTYYINNIVYDVFDENVYSVLSENTQIRMCIAYIDKYERYNISELEINGKIYLFCASSMPATVLNVVGDDVSSMLVTRIVDGKKGFRDVL